MKSVILNTVTYVFDRKGSSDTIQNPSPVRALSSETIFSEEEEVEAVVPLK